MRHMDYVHVGLAALLCVMLGSLGRATAQAADAVERTIIDDWATVAAPPAPELQKIALTSAETALLVLDIQTQTCNAERRPRCVASVPNIRATLAQARATGATVVHSLIPSSAVTDILPDVAPVAGEPVVQSSVDKFFNTELEKILRDKGIKTVVIAGTAANGAVLHTATGAAMRGFQVIIPVDLMSADLYAEQYVAWHLVNAPGSRRQTTLTQVSALTWNE